jgi:hypothetical protein
MAALALTVGCTTAPKVEPVPPAPPPPPPSAANVECPATPIPKKEHGKLVVMLVDRNARPEFDCVDIKFENTAVIWTGDADVKELRVFFKNPTAISTPRPPSCSLSHPTCLLPLQNHNMKGEFSYGISVVLKDETPVTADPKLIINP